MSAQTEERMYDLDEIATTADLDAAPIGSILVTWAGEGSAWFKVGQIAWARPANGTSMGRKRPGHWFCLKDPVLVWEAPQDRPLDPPFSDESFFALQQKRMGYAGRRMSVLIAEAADTFHIPLDVRTRIVAAILAGEVRP